MGSCTESLIGHNAAISLFRLLLGDYLSIGVDTSAVIIFPSPLLFLLNTPPHYISPFVGSLPSGKCILISIIILLPLLLFLLPLFPLPSPSPPSSSSSSFFLFFFFNFLKGEHSFVCAGRCVSELASLRVAGCLRKITAGRPSQPQSSRETALQPRHGVRDSWGPCLLLATQKHMQPLNIPRETKAGAEN